MSTRSSSAEKGSAEAGRRTTIRPSSSPPWLTGATRSCPVPAAPLAEPPGTAPSATPGSHTDAHACPDTPARAMIGRSRLPTISDRGPVSGHAAVRSSTSPMPV